MKKVLTLKSDGFTMMELVVSIAIAAIVGLGITMTMLYSQRAYQVAYDRIYAEIITESFMARRLFDATVRKSNASSITIETSGDDAKFQYYNSDVSTYIDRYIRFYISNNNFLAEYGSIDQNGVQTSTNTRAICSDISFCMFRNNGSSISMILALNDGDRSNIVVTSAYAHN